MSRIRLALVTVSLLTLSGPTHATYFVTGSTLSDRCQKKDGAIGESFCIGYVAGIVDTLDGFHFCVPSNSELGQSVKVVQKYLNEHPEQLHKSASRLAIDALKAAFPCRR